jgi:hypothetical protein
MKKCAFLLIQGVFLFQLYGSSQNNGTKDAQANLITVVQVINKPVSTLLQTSFNSLTLNPATVKNVSGIPSFTASDFDFTNLYKSEKKGETEIAYSAAYKGTVTKEKYAFVLFMKDGVPLRSMLVRANPDRSILIFYDLTDGKTAEIIKIKDSYIYEKKSVDFGGRTDSGPGCGQAVMDCITDAYTNHGWTSVWVTIQSIFVPSTGVAITLGCIVKNCKIKTPQP